MSDWEEETVRLVVRRFKVKSGAYLPDMARAESAAARAWWESPKGHRHQRDENFDTSHPMGNLPDDAFRYVVGDEHVILEFSYEEPIELPGIPRQR